MSPGLAHQPALPCLTGLPRPAYCAPGRGKRQEVRKGKAPATTHVRNKEEASYRSTFTHSSNATC